MIFSIDLTTDSSYLAVNAVGNLLMDRLFNVKDNSQVIRDHDIIKTNVQLLMPVMHYKQLWNRAIVPSEDDGRTIMAYWHSGKKMILFDIFNSGDYQYTLSNKDYCALEKRIDFIPLP
jgi:hypothetical protein